MFAIVILLKLFEKKNKPKMNLNYFYVSNPSSMPQAHTHTVAKLIPIDHRINKNFSHIHNISQLCAWKTQCIAIDGMAVLKHRNNGKRDFLLIISIAKLKKLSKPCKTEINSNIPSSSDRLIQYGVCIFIIAQVKCYSWRISLFLRWLRLNYVYWVFNAFVCALIYQFH